MVCEIRRRAGYRRRGAVPRIVFRDERRAAVRRPAALRGDCKWICSEPGGIGSPRARTPAQEQRRRGGRAGTTGVVDGRQRCEGVVQVRRGAETGHGGMTRLKCCRADTKTVNRVD